MNMFVGVTGLGLPYDVGPARAFLGEAEKPTMCGLGVTILVVVGVTGLG